MLLNAEAHFLKFVLPCPVTLQKTALIVVMTHYLGESDYSLLHTGYNVKTVQS
ncbi:hypothetical protein ECEC1846_3167 [Escherichia coli EC1846]|uniref:Uncharacterized protein n=3 Tax=Escherichia coli TaxID=562 RepID=A0A0H3PKZ1_ECO5C|nr:hypothetical protein ECH74115_3284 [Escherichia coli O157:H7 str. EC4115]AIG69479.1 hypothetical protein EDL933_3313 [Escherichia coli O157:H7 str. EDL933]AJA27015.1 hypothetical protein SS52_3166 [Escherichia coli O157:H7 str. SS52]ASL58433.1 hypothetical protein FORC44_1680 [Escherichia coli]EDU34933.1 hypothetical protein ECH7EC4196_4815 [Escherichia coli O157:H7 str. EC4196]EDU53423.1 hypothetical protein ECH7EC4113_1531 [Escherichia coli O157:H7 str. EC4113]EDU71026.1 hypothetical pro